VKENKLKYSGLTYTDILTQVNDLIESDPKFDNFRESSITQMLVELFAGSTDIMNYYIQRRAEECFFDTAKLKSSVISKSRELAYDITRYTPAKTTITLVLRGDIKKALIDAGSDPKFVTDPTDPNYKMVIGPSISIQIPYYSKFSGGGSNFVLLDTYTLNISYDIWNAMSVGPDYIQTFNSDSWGNDVTLIEGEIREKIISGVGNTQTNAPFQIYKLDDTTFSNIYGDKDYFFNKVTQVYVGEQKTPDNRYRIERKSLLDWESMVSANLDNPSKVCLIRTSNDEGVELLFGDDRYAKKGPITSRENIYIQYLSTKGANANKIGVVGDRLSHSGNIYTNTGVNISQYVSFEFKSNIVGGFGMESIDSIKYYSPKIYYSLDRLVSKDDYMAYLTSVKTPIVVRNAVAWGEQEERDRYNKFAIARMFNTVLFTVAGSLYYSINDRMLPKNDEDLEDALLDNNYDAYGFNTQGYFNVFITKEQVAQLRRYVVDTEYNAIKGDPLYSKNVWSDIKNTYGDNAAYLEIIYGSDDYANASNVDGKKLNNDTYDNSLVIDMSALPDASTDSDSGMVLLAQAINDALITTLDRRANASDNANYNKPAFIGRYFDTANPQQDPKIIIWNIEARRFELTFNEKLRYNHKESPCYIKEILDTGFSSAIGLAGEKILGVSEGERGHISTKITTLVNDLETRSQISVKHIYISPIIHRFNLVGDIQIKSLFDREQTKVEINNLLYEFLDLDNDFNKPLYISNLIEIIEKHPAVMYANVKLEPEDRTIGKYSHIGDSTIPADHGNVNDRNKNYDSDYYTAYSYGGKIKTLRILHPILKKYSVAGGKNPIFDDISEALQVYLSNSSYIPDSWSRFFAIKYNVRPSSSYDHKENEDNVVTLEESYYNINNFINERTFYIDFASLLYSNFLNKAKMQTTSCDYDSYTCWELDGSGNRIEVPNYRKFIGYNPVEDEYNSSNIFDDVVSTSFSKVLSEIHTDLSYLIMSNMLDGDGNIQSKYDSNGRYIRGGYSLNTEIIQVNAEYINFTYDGRA